MKFKRSTVIAMIVLSLLPIVVTALLYNSLPAEIPTHWGIDGTVTYSPKSEIWPITGLTPLMALLFIVVPNIDPKKRNYKRFSGVYELFCVVIMLFMLAMSSFMLIEALRPGTVNVSKVVPFMVGVLFIYIGNIMPKVKHNYSFGVKTPWALADTDVWSKSYRIAGFISFAGGIVIAVSSLLLPEKPLFIVLMAFVAIFVLVPSVMSYIWFRQKQTPNDEE